MGAPTERQPGGNKNNKLGALKCSEIHKDSFLPSVLGTQFVFLTLSSVHHMTCRSKKPGKAALSLA